jgi:metallo-beta-lactamase family protein
MRDYMQRDPDPFGFDNLHYIRTIDESKKLNNINQPCVIISASGMMEAGRVKHHIANNIEDKKTTILAVGYCAPTTLGAKILRGDNVVSIFGTQYFVRAEIRRIDSYSAHADYQEMLTYLSCQEKKKVKKIFLVHGEEETQNNFANTLMENGYKNIYIPSKKEAVTI